MKRVIDGKLYNTETARRLGFWSYSNRRDFSFVAETLFKTKSGNYFLHGEGGAHSKYSKSHGNNSWGGGEEIIPIDETAAKKWAEERLDAEEYISIFGEPEEA